MPRLAGYRILRTALFSLAWLLMAASCVRENIEGCPVTVELRFRYFGDGITDHFGERVDSVSMWVYRPDGSFHSSTMISQVSLDTLQGVRLSLPEGDWRLVFWGNDGDGSEVLADDHEEHIAPVEYRVGRMPSSLEQFYYGAAAISLPLSLRVQRDTVDFAAASIGFTIEFVGFITTEAALTAAGSAVIAGRAGLRASSWSAPLHFVHSGMHAAIGSDGTPSRTRTDWQPELTADTAGRDLLTARYRTPRFDDSDCGELQIWDSPQRQTLLWSQDLASILSEQGISTEGRDEVEVRLRIVRRIDSVTGYVTIEVIPWNTEIIYPIL